MDWIGINFYATVRVQGTGDSSLPEFSPLLTANLLSLEINYDQPAAMTEMLGWLDATYDRPLIVTENGAGLGSDPGDKQSRFLVRHLAAVLRARDRGTDVQGYFYWTLMDNYEWNHGMDIEMGLYAVDPTDPSKARTARGGVATYGRIAEEGALPADLRDQFLEN